MAKLPEFIQHALGPFISGFLFTLGIGIGGVGDAKNVLAFLDVLGDWNSRLVIVLIVALITHTFLSFFIRKTSCPLCEDHFEQPSYHKIDKKLIIGAILFGVGWGISGFCPGPAILSVVTNDISVYAFLGAMFLGMVVTKKIMENR